MKYQAAVLTVSDKCSRGEREDTSGPALCEMLSQAGFDVAWTGVVPDEKEQIGAALVRLADELRIPLVITTGGTGFSERVNALFDIAHKEEIGLVAGDSHIDFVLDFVGVLVFVYINLVKAIRKSLGQFGLQTFTVFPLNEKLQSKSL